MCRACGNANPAAYQWCSNCRAAKRGDVELIDLREAQQRQARSRRRVTARRLGYWAIVVGLVLLVSGWYVLPRLGIALFSTAPTLSISSEPAGMDWSMFQRDLRHSGTRDPRSGAPSGVLKWRYEADGPIYASPAVVNGVVYLATGAGTIAAIDAETGAEVWAVSVEGPLNSSPAIAGNLLFIGRFDGVVEARDVGTGDPRWEFITGDRVLSSPAVHQGVVYIGSGDGNLYSIDAGTGRERWTYDTGGWISSSPAIFDNVVAIVSFDGLLHVVDRRTGKKRLDFYLSATPRGSAAFGETWLLVADGLGRLKAVDWRQRTIPLEWLSLRI